jgi:hypothetical protein
MPVTAVDSLALSVSSLSRGNILYEIDGQPALDLYKKYLGDKSSELPQALLYPLNVTHMVKEPVVRTILILIMISL